MVPWESSVWNEPRIWVPSGKRNHHSTEKQSSWYWRAFQEALLETSSLCRKLLCQMLQQRSGLNSLIRPWATARMVPIYKCYSPKEPKRYRPISLLSQWREMIESGIARITTDKYAVSDAQLGLQRMDGTLCAPSRYTLQTSNEWSSQRVWIWNWHIIGYNEFS